MKKIIIAALSISLASQASAQAPIKPGVDARKEAKQEVKPDKKKKAVRNIRILIAENFIAYNSDTKQILAEIKLTVDKLEKAPAKHKLPDLTGKLKMTFSKDKELKLELETAPAIDAKKKQALLAELKQGCFGKTRYFDMPIVIYFKAGKGDPANHQYLLEPTVQEARVAKIKQASLKEAGEIIRDYVVKQAIPLTAYMQRSVAGKYPGVKGIGAKMSKLTFDKPIDVTKVLDEDVLYWRGCMEMSRNNPLVSSSRILLHAANGNFDQAARFLGIYMIFSDQKSTSTTILMELFEMISAHKDKVNAEIDKGIKLHDQQKFDEAKKIYLDLLEQYPFSAFAEYEVWFAENTKNTLKGDKKLGGEDDFASWKVAQKKIYGIDPMYPLDVRAKSPREQFMMMRRMQMKALLDRAMDPKSLIEYADIAKDLGAYSFAAELYWIIASNIEKKQHGDRDIAELYLYCVYKAGAKDIAKLIKKNMNIIVKEQAADLKARMEKKK